MKERLSADAEFLNSSARSEPLADDLSVCHHRPSPGKRHRVDEELRIEEPGYWRASACAVADRRSSGMRVLAHVTISRVHLPYFNFPSSDPLIGPVARYKQGAIVPRGHSLSSIMLQPGEVHPPHIREPVCVGPELETDRADMHKIPNRLMGGKGPSKPQLAAVLIKANL